MNKPQVNARPDSNENKKEFICGVVEGFYGKPWSFEQRKDLFKRLRDLKLNSFMYAPKDDTKHRSKWRQPYSEIEANQLRTLIHEAKANGIDFYYSLAPGLDMVYSEREEIELLLRKYDQLVGLGCESFAILFDDIEPAIHERDREVFKNYAAAQVSVTNVVFEHLNRPKFLFCPTEYCESRAVPSVTNSSYLNTIGAGLLDGIDIMWSGPRVISRFITEESIETLTKVIQRPPVIWENLHANDYDKKRVFLGPYSGRSTKIIPKLRGVLTNPNCEYEANYVAIHTLAQWSKCTEDINLHNRHNPNKRPSDVSARSDSDRPSTKIYDPDQALFVAIRDWLPYVCEKRSLPMGINLTMHSKERNDDAAGAQLVLEPINNKDQEIATNVDMMDEETVSSSGSNTKSDMDMSSSPAPMIPIETSSCDSCDMQDATEQQQQQQQQNKLPPIGADGAERNLAAGLERVLCSSATEEAKTATVVAAPDPSPISDQLSLDNLSLLVDLFYLPFEHGLHGCALLREIEWLRDNSDILISENSNSKEQPAEVEVVTPVAGAQVLDNDDPNKVTADELGASKEAQMNVDDSDHQAVKQSEQQQESKMGSWLERAEKLNNLCTCINRLVNTLIVSFQSERERERAREIVFVKWSSRDFST